VVPRDLPPLRLSSQNRQPRKPPDNQVSHIDTFGGWRKCSTPATIHRSSDCRSGSTCAVRLDKPIPKTKGTTVSRPSNTERARARVKRTYLSLCALIGAAALAVSPSVASAASAQGQAIVNAAAAMHGKPYCWDGGNRFGPSHGRGDLGYGGCPGHTKGFDCSGLALFAVFQATGTLLPHGHGMQAGHGGQLITNQASLEPGDLVFFGGSLSHFDHVGIYAGGGEVWDADDFNVPVQKHSLRWIEHGLHFDGAVRYWRPNLPPAPGTPETPGGGTGPGPQPEAPTTPPPSQPPTLAETTGGAAHTWTNYANAGGIEGPSIPSNATVQIGCRVTGFRVEDGNTWWYRIASSPWNGAFYVSADAFYNNGQTSGGLIGTPFVDPAVPGC
jgi:cell wall-associated NlpC family hydrolase